MFFYGSGALPIEFSDAYICDLFEITYTELQKQPQKWVEQMMLIKSEKANAQKALSKQENKPKT